MTTQTQRLPITALPCVAVAATVGSLARSFVRSLHLQPCRVIFAASTLSLSLSSSSSPRTGLGLGLGTLCLDRSRLPLFVWAMSAWTSSFFSAQQVQLLKIPEFACEREKEREGGRGGRERGRWRQASCVGSCFQLLLLLLLLVRSSALVFALIMRCDPIQEPIQSQCEAKQKLMWLLLLVGVVFLRKSI